MTHETQKRFLNLKSPVWRSNDCQNDGKLSDVAKREEDKASDITAKGGETKVKKEGLFQVYLTKH